MHAHRQLAAVALLAGLLAVPAFAANSQTATPTRAELLARSGAGEWRTPDPHNLLVMQLPTGRVLIELAPDFTPLHAANIRTMARQHYYDGLAIVRVPLAAPLAALVFLGAFIPIVGSVLAGTVAVLVALVANGFVPALIVLAIVIAVMQLEGHVLQPFLMGRAVRLHPLSVVLAIATGSVIAGIIGALLAVPLLAVLNSAIRSLLHDPPMAPTEVNALRRSEAQPHDAAIPSAEAVAEPVPVPVSEPGEADDPPKVDDAGPGQHTD